MIPIYLALNDREYQEKLAEGLAWRGSGWEVHSCESGETSRKSDLAAAGRAGWAKRNGGKFASAKEYAENESNTNPRGRRMLLLPAVK